MPPLWLTVVSWVSLGAAFLFAGLILCDLFVRGYRQHIRIMDAVWPIIALYFGPTGLPPLGAAAEPQVGRGARRDPREGLRRLRRGGGQPMRGGLLMQIGMNLGFATAYPANWWLMRRGTKEAT